MKARLKALINDYGPLALTVYFVIFFATWAGFAVAIKSGLQTHPAGVVVGAWLATKLTQPLRIVATLFLTPVVGRFRGVCGPRLR